MWHAEFNSTHGRYFAVSEYCNLLLSVKMEGQSAKIGILSARMECLSAKNRTLSAAIIFYRRKYYVIGEI